MRLSKSFDKKKKTIEESIIKLNEYIYLVLTQKKGIFLII
jgi:hypothetical protein